jgi:Tol biopolymer transport system component
LELTTLITVAARGFGMLLRISFIAAVLSQLLFAQYYGVNKVQYKNFRWNYIQSEHFDVYFYEGGYDIAAFTIEVAESAYVEIKRDFRYDINKRLALIVYNSHNDFQQTNVITSYLDEGIGGVTELFKNRIIIPYEGSYSQFRHVIHHELVHGVMNDMLYGGSIQSLISGQVTQVPLWMAEGIAEFESERWNTRLDMVVRDATISGYLPPIQFLDYFPYQGGASVFRYIAQKYGNQKIGEIMHKIKGSRNFQAAFKSALSIDFDDLTEEWQRQMKREYWPELAGRKESGEFAKALTDHRKDNSYINISPAISPQGDRLVFISNRGGHQSVYLMDILEGKVVKRLIKGETDINFEELHFLAPGMSWSPDGRKIALAAKAGDADALYIFDIPNDSYEQYKFDLDGIFSAAWSPKGNEIAFVGNMNGASDIYIFDMEDQSITNITNDVFSDQMPSWSFDGSKIVFVSDRGPYIREKFSPSEYMMHLHDYENDDIYVINRDGSNMQRITTHETKQLHPKFTPDDTHLIYVSEESGVANIIIHNIQNDSVRTVSNLLTGAYQVDMDRDAQKLVFTSFYRGGYDIFMIKNPLQLKSVQVEKTSFFKQREKEGMDFLKEEPVDVDITGETLDLQANDYSSYVFARMDHKRIKKNDDIKLSEDEYKTNDGNYRIKNYKIKFSPDLINGAAGFNTYYGLQGYTQIALSDMLGDHKIYIGTDLVMDLRNSNIEAYYYYLPHRIDYGFGAFHRSYFFIDYYNGSFMRYRNYGLNFSVSRPFNKFSRLDLGFNWMNISLEYFDQITSEKIQAILPSVAWVVDRIEWGMTGPNDGMRSSISVLFSPFGHFRSIDFRTVKFDYRRYFKFASAYNFAFRFYTGASFGREPQVFFLGGVPNWFNRSFAGGWRIDNIRDVFFSEFITPLRGARYYEQVGNTFGLVNAELRFPMIPYMQLGIPPIALGNIQGALFTDIGTAKDWQDWKTYQLDKVVKDTRFVDDLISGYGIGARIFFLGFLLRYDIAWQYDITSFKTISQPVHYWSIGADF